MKIALNANQVDAMRRSPVSEKNFVCQSGGCYKETVCIMRIASNANQVDAMRRSPVSEKNFICQSGGVSIRRLSE